MPCFSGDLPFSLSIRLFFLFFSRVLSIAVLILFSLIFFPFNFSLTHLSTFIFYSLYSVHTLEKLYFGLLWWASATNGVAFRLSFVLSRKSIGRIYRTCYLHESNRRWDSLTKLLLFWPGPVFPAGRVQPRRLRHPCLVWTLHGESPFLCRG
jgi:hypothetical protein